MRRLIDAAKVALLCIAACCASELSEAQFSSFPPGVFVGHAAKDASGGGGAFTGIADVYTNTVAHWSSNRAASSARRGQKLLNVCDAATGLVCVDWSSSATTGLIVPTTIGGSSCGVISCEAAIAYDDSGVSGINLSAAHGSRPTVSLNCVNGLPCLVCNGSQNLTGTGLTANQPYTLSAVAERTGSTSVKGAFYASGQDVVFHFYNTAGEVSLYSGSTEMNTTGSGLTEGVFHAIQAVGSGASSSIQGDGQAPTTGNPGVNSNNPGDTIYICNDGFGEFLTGAVAEVWVGTTNQSATFNSAHSNQSTAYGTP